MIDEMELELGNFHGERVSCVLKSATAFVDFTAENYRRTSGLTRPKLYLLSKQR